ncbi:MFS transporter [Actinopolymorpha pittospori]
MGSSEPDDQDRSDPAQRRYAWQVLALNVVVVSQPALNAGMLNLALPDITRQTSATNTQITLVVSAYWLVSTVLLLSFGRLADMLGRRRLYIAGIATFTLACAGCAAATSADVLILMRVLQAVGAAAIIVNSSALLTDAFPRDLLSTGMGISASIFSAFGLAGPVVGGALVTRFGGQAVFWFSVPFGVIGLVGALLLLRPHLPTTRQSFDYVGAGLSAVALTGLLVFLSSGQSWGWGNPVGLGVATFSAGMLVAFVLFERGRRNPLLDLRLFTVWSRAAAYVCHGLVAVSDFSIALLLSLYFQRVMGLTALDAGLRLVPSTVGALVAAPLAGRLARRYESRVLSSWGVALHAAALLALVFAFPAHPPYWVTGVCLAAIGVGTGLFTTPNTHAIMASVEPDRRGVAGAVRSTIANVAGLTGTALVLAVVAGPSVAARVSASSFQVAGLVLFTCCVVGTFLSLARGRQHNPSR